MNVRMCVRFLGFMVIYIFVVITMDEMVRNLTPILFYPSPKIGE